MHVSGTRVLLATLLGALALQVWGMVWWMGLGMMVEPVGALPPAVESAVVDTLLDENIAEGAYFIPGIPGEATPEAEEIWTTKQRSGPLGLFLYHPDGTEPLEPALFVRGFVINAASCLLACLVITPGVRTGWGFPRVVGAALAFGLVASMVAYGNLWNWMHAPTGFTWKMSTDILGGWLFAGIAISAVLKRSAGTVTAIAAAAVVTSE